MAAHLTKTVVLSAISCRGRVYTYTKDSYFYKEDVIQFVRGLRRMSSSNKIVLFWDNASIHKAKIVQEFLEEVDI